MQPSQKFSPRLKSVAVAAALCVISGGAFASTVVDSISATYSYKLGADATETLSQIKPAPFPGERVDVVAFPYSAGNSAVVHSYGYTGGNFGSRSSGSGVYDVSGAFKIVMTIANTTSVAQTASFNFNITPGWLSNSIASALTGSDFVSAGLSFDLRRNGAAVWGSAATLNSIASGTTFSQSRSNPLESSLYARSSDTEYSVLGVSRSIDLGVINAGDSIQLSYEIESFAKGSSVAGPARIVPDREYFVPGQWVEACTYGYGYGGYGDGETCTFGTPRFVEGHIVKVPGYTIPGGVSGSHASSGDPFDIDSAGNVISDPTLLRSAAIKLGASVSLAPVAVGAIPEPETYALMLGGLALVGWMARRRRDAAAA